MRRVLDLAAIGFVGTVVAVTLLLLRPFGSESVLHVYLLFIGAVVMLGAVAATRTVAPERRRSPLDAALRRRPRADERPPQLERVERGVTLGVSLAADFHARLRPQLREIAAARLALARGVDLDSPAGRAAVGEDAWELLRPDRAAPDDRFGPGVPEHRLRALVETLETL